MKAATDSMTFCGKQFLVQDSAELKKALGEHELVAAVCAHSEKLAQTAGRMSAPVNAKM